MSVYREGETGTIFKTDGNPATESQQWDGEVLLEQIEKFESDARNKPVPNVGRTSPYPRILPLRGVLKTTRRGQGTVLFLAHWSTREV